MTDFNIATGAEQPINRTGVDNVQITGEKQGVLVGIDTGPDPNELVAADADSGTAIQAVGALLPEEVIDASSLPTGDHFQDLEQQLIEENRTLDGDRVVVVRYGVELVNDDDDTSFTPGEPVYLDTGGGYTQTKPSGSGDLVQTVGVALDPDGDGRDRILLHVDADYETLA